MVEFFLSLMLVSTPAAVPTESHLLASSAREELAIVDRLHSLRASVEKLPADWKASNVKGVDEGTLLTKQDLVDELENLELSAAERWTILIENTALIDHSAAVDEHEATSYRARFENLSTLHFQAHKQIAAFNEKLKSGILKNLASKALSKQVVN